MAIRDILVKKDCYICGGRENGCYDCGGKGYETGWVSFEELVNEIENALTKQKETQCRGVEK